MTLGRRDLALLAGDSGAAGETTLSYAHKPTVRVLSDPSGRADHLALGRELAPAHA